VVAENESDSRSMKLRPRRRVPKTSDYVARELADEIISSGLAAGSMLPAEREMTEALGVGRGTLREALRLLEARGVLRMKVGPGGGPVVRHPAPSDLAEGLSLILQFESGTLDDVVSARIALESSVVRSLAESGDAEVVARLSEINALLGEASGDEATFRLRYQDFHNTLANLGGGALMQLFVQALSSIFDAQSSGVVLSSAARKRVHAAHGALVAAIEEGDTVAAERVLARHLKSYYAAWRKAAPQEPVLPVRLES
jgi:GntR family transcriptional repressor for pyruvate dehydrogenase complex